MVSLEDGCVAVTNDRVTSEIELLTACSRMIMLLRKERL